MTDQSPCLSVAQGAQHCRPFVIRVSRYAKMPFTNGCQAGPGLELKEYLATILGQATPEDAPTLLEE